MRYIGEWSTSDQKKFVIIAPDVLAVFWKYRQRFFWQPESGGILLGRRRGKHLEVIAATVPSSQDRCSTYHFVREVDGHAEVAQQAWIKGECQVDYLGEWHTHPQAIPIPSGLDRAEWRKLTQQRSEKTKLLAVVVGTEHLRVELVDDVRFEVLESILPAGKRETR